MLTDAERTALAMTGQLAQLLYWIVQQGEDPIIVAQDWNEIAHDIHHIQNAIMAQAAARLYPNELRALGCQFPMSGG